MMLRDRAVFIIIAALSFTGCSGHLAPVPQGESGDATSAKTIESASVSTVPMFQSSFVFGGKTFTYRMVGQNPALKTSTTIPSEIVPIKLIFADGTTFDPASVVTGLRGSPLFVNAPFAAGSTQYTDALMRSEFWHTVANSNYHVRLGTPTVFATVTEHVTSANGFTTTVNGVKQGRVTFAWFINTLEPQLIRQFGIKPTSLAFFIASNTRVLEPGSTTHTFGGYHDSFHLTTTLGSGIFGTIWGAMFSANPHDVTHVGHEVAEWFNDPLYPSSPNMVPAWVNPLSHACNGTLLEVADPVTTDLFTVNGYTFEDAVFLPWFTRTSPSTGINGQYDLRNLLRTAATSC